MKTAIAVVEDEQDIAALVSLHLERAGHTVKTFPDAGSFFKSFPAHSPDLVILDIMLPDTDGMDVCRELKKNDRTASIPIIMLTARGEEADRVLGLELGADDYITKPFSPRELVARVKAVLRRRAAGATSTRITVGGLLEIDRDKHDVWVKGKRVDLTATEFRILTILSDRTGWVFSRDQILDALWGTEKAVLDRTIDVHIKNLREKLGPAGHLIVNIRGTGYKLRE